MDDPLPEPTEISVSMSQNFQGPELLSSEVAMKKLQKPVPVTTSAENAKTTLTPNGSVTSKDRNASTIGKKKIEAAIGGSVPNPAGERSTLMKSTVTSALRSTGVVPAIRRNSTGGVTEKKKILPVKPHENVASAKADKATSSTSSESVRRSLHENRRSSLPSVNRKSTARTNIAERRNAMPGFSDAKTPRPTSSSEVTKQDSLKRPSAKPSLASVSSSRKVATTSLDSTSNSSSIRRSMTKVSSPSSQSPSVSSGQKGGSLSGSVDRSSVLSGRKKVGAPETRDSHLIMLPHVEIKAGDNVRLDLRGYRIRNLNSNGLNLSPNLEFVYLRDNLLSALDGVEILKHVKVLDLSFNDFKGPGFEPLANCKALQQLYLAGNQITSLVSLPELPNLEFLSVAQNKLKSLGMASQPRLQVLAASKNQLCTLKGFPNLPALEHLRVEENPILKMCHLEAASILLIGPTLKKFNDRDLSREAIALAKRYPAHTALCIQKGWEFCSPDQAVDSTYRFLLEQWKEIIPPGYVLNKASIDKPFEEDCCCCHFDFVKDEMQPHYAELVLRYQWFIGQRTPSNFLAIPGASKEIYWPKREDVSRMLKVECTPILGEIEYPTIFAISSPVATGTGIPKVLKIDVLGDLVEGNVITGQAEIAWCGGTPGKGVSSWLRRWNSSPLVISGAENEEYTLTLDDIGSCLVYMYTPVTEEGAKGEPQYAITDHIKAAPPSVSDLQIIGESVEGNTIKGVGKYFGGREGPSKFHWSRENDSAEFVLVCTGTNEYTLRNEDIGRRLKFSYVPVNFEGQEGKSLMVVSQIVKKAPPKVANVKIVGELQEGSKVTVSGIVTGGTEASSRVQWFKTCSSLFDGEDSLEPLSSTKIAKAFRIPLGAVGYYIVAKFTPMTPEGETGEAAYVVSEKAIETLPPSINFLSITGDCYEGGILTASYGYIGGHEGRSIYAWYFLENENDTGPLVPELSGVLQCRITKDAIGKFILFSCTPVRDDGIVGESKTYIAHERIRPGSPRLLSLEVLGSTTEGATLGVQKKYSGGEEGESIYRWFRTSSSGACTEITGVTASSYIISVEDIGLFISVSCEPVRNDGVHGPLLVSELVGPIVAGFPTCQSLEFIGSLIEGERLGFNASYSGGEKGDCLIEWFLVDCAGGREELKCGEFLDLTLEHVAEHVELVFTPVRKDGIKGNPLSLMSSSPIAPGDPVGVELVIPECYEGKLMVPHVRYFGGHEGAGEYIWYRTNNKLQITAPTDLLDASDDIHICGKTLSYTPSLQDVGAYLGLYWVPSRSDGKSGQPLVSVCDSPVIPALPVASSVQVKEISSTIYLGEGEYFGGYEGSSLFSWYRQIEDGSVLLIDGANTKTYEVTYEDYKCRLLFGYTPVRSDSVIGELKLSDATNIILPEIPRIEMLDLTGEPIEGEVITAVEVMPNSESQQKVWENYKKNVRYQWFYSSETGSSKSFLPLPSQWSCSYKIRFEDIGCCLRCECSMTDIFGRSSAPVYAETVYISPGIPVINKLEIEGRGFHTNLYAVRGTYSGGKEGKSKIQWLRSMVGSPDLITIPGETGRMYEANVDDVGYRLVALYTPVREDGVEGRPLSVSTDPIAVEPDILKEVKVKLELGSVKFEVLCSKNPHPQKNLGQGALERRVLEVNRKRIKVVKPGSKTSFPTTEIRGSYSPPFHVEVFRNDQHTLRIVVDSDNEVDLMVQTRHSRDVIVLVIRGLAQRFNSTSLNSLLKIDA